MAEVQIPTWAAGTGAVGLTVIVVRQAFAFAREIAMRKNGNNGNGLDRQALQQLTTAMAVQTQILDGMKDALRDNRTAAQGEHRAIVDCLDVIKERLKS